MLICCITQALADPAQPTVPETTTPSSTAMPSISELPNFQTLNLIEYEWTLSTLMQNCCTLIANDLQTEATWTETIQPIEELIGRVKSMWNLVIILNNVAQTEQTQAIVTKLLPKIVDFHHQIMHNQDLYKAYTALQSSKDFTKLTPTQQISVNQTVLDFKLRGAALSPEQQQQYAALIKRLRELASEYIKNLNFATKSWHLHIAPADQAKLDGLPEFIKKQAAANAKTHNKDGWILTLDDTTLISVESYSRNSELREQLYKSFVSLASKITPNSPWDNTAITAETLKLRQELATLLGFKNYAEYAVADRQPPNPTQAMQFLDNLATQLKPIATKEYAELQTFAKQNGNTSTLQAWDVAYYAQAARAMLAQDSQQQSMEYLHIKSVMQGLFNLASILFNIDFNEIKDASTWHPDVKLYTITDVNNKIIAYVYLDLYAREGKNNNDRTQMYTSRINTKPEILPVSVMTTNLSAKANGQLTHDEVVKLFAEFGEMLQRNLMLFDYPNFSSTSGMTWDAITLSGQFMQNWAWQKDFIFDIAVHYKTGAKMPEDLFRILSLTHDFDSAINLLQQLQLAMLDLRVHMNLPQDQHKTTADIYKEIRKQYEVLPIVAIDNLPNRFIETFCTDYASTFYSFYWDKMLAADAFAAFTENEIFSAKIGHKYRDTILQLGGQASVLDLFTKFRGRPPEIGYLLAKETNH